MELRVIKTVISPEIKITPYCLDLKYRSWLNVSRQIDMLIILKHAIDFAIVIQT